jgi:MFS family permease
LAARGDFRRAFDVLMAINGKTQAEKELEEIRRELGNESESLRELIRPGVRWAVLIGIVLMVFSQINGVNMILIYAPTLFIAAGINDASAAILNSVYLTAWITLCTVAAFWLTAKFSRRAILIVGVLGMAAGHAWLFFSFTYSLSMIATLIGMFLAAGAFTLSLAPLSWVILSEIYPNRVRGKAMSLATMLMFIASYATVHAFPIILDRFERIFGNPGCTFLIFMGVCLLCSLFVWKYLPETKDKSLEEISRFWTDDY